MLPGFDLIQKVISSGFHTSRLIGKALTEIFFCLFVLFVFVNYFCFYFILLSFFFAFISQLIGDDEEKTQIQL